MNNETITRLLRNEVKPALGCTAPVAVALATARCRTELTAPALECTVILSPGIYKNGWGVSIPGTSERGNALGAALGLIAGDASQGLEVLQKAAPEDLKAAGELLKQDFVRIRCDRAKDGIYVAATVVTKNESVTALVEYNHSMITQVTVNGELVFQAPAGRNEQEEPDPTALSVDGILDYIQQVPWDQIRFLLEGVKMNLDLADDGLNGNYGLTSGQALRTGFGAGRLPDDPLLQARILTCAASDARMGGSLLPAMSTVGSGNQGITAIIPVAIVAKTLQASDETLARALAMSHLVTYFVKLYAGRISSMCLCAVASSAGAASAITWMSGGGIDAIRAAIKNVVCTLGGLLCDGAKNGCALKMGAAASEAIVCSRLALLGVELSTCDGICDASLEDTLRNLGTISSATKQQIDHAIVSILDNKTARQETR